LLRLPDFRSDSCIDHSINHIKGQNFFLDREEGQRPVIPLNTPLYSTQLSVSTDKKLILKKLTKNTSEFFVLLWTTLNY